MSNEPVAWTTNELDTTNWGDTDWQITVTKERWSDKQIPLYTHPAKTLTDEEIKEMYNEHCVEGKHGFNYFKWLDFSRAILRKAKENG